MPKKAISSLELAALVNELQFLVQGKISQIYHQEKKEMLLQLHARGRGKELLKIISGKWLCLTGMKLVPLRPSGFCMQLRKYINNAVIKDIYQKDAERIVVFELEKEKRYSLIVELFSKGNVILTDEMSTIITSLERQIWKDRVVKPGEKYVFPKSEVNWKKITEKELATILKKSEKKNLAVSLATEVGLGGLYAEEVCRKNEIDKNKIPQDITEKEAKEIINTSKEFLKWITHTTKMKGIEKTASLISPPRFKIDLDKLTMDYSTDVRQVDFDKRWDFYTSTEINKRHISKDNFDSGPDNLGNMQ